MLIISIDKAETGGVLVELATSARHFKRNSYDNKRHVRDYKGRTGLSPPAAYPTMSVAYTPINGISLS